MSGRKFPPKGWTLTKTAEADAALSHAHAAARMAERAAELADRVPMVQVPRGSSALPCVFRSHAEKAAARALKAAASALSAAKRGDLEAASSAASSAAAELATVKDDLAQGVRFS
jgi:hypothetical protein